MSGDIGEEINQKEKYTCRKNDKDKNVFFGSIKDNTLGTGVVGYQANPLSEVPAASRIVHQCWHRSVAAKATTTCDACIPWGAGDVPPAPVLVQLHDNRLGMRPR